MGRGASKRLHKGIQFPCAEPAVHFRDEVREFLGVPLGKAAENEKTAHLPRLFPLGGFQDNLDGLFLGIPYETAGVYCKDIYR